MMTSPSSSSSSSSPSNPSGATSGERERAILGTDKGINAQHLVKVDAPIKIRTVDLNVYYGAAHALKHINLEMADRQVTALMGPSGCGKSTFLRSLNRMHDLTPIARVTGSILFDGEDVLSPSIDVVHLRQRVGMVFQRPNPFPQSIFENVAYGLRVQGGVTQTEIKERVERSLRSAAIWDEVKDRLGHSALGLSGGQQQRLCIARALAVEPEIILMDEPCSALDPIATLKIEELIEQLKRRYTIVIVTHNLQQAARVSQYTGFFLSGDLIEFNVTAQIFSRPQDQRTEDFITGRFG
ncbi:MAG TPA: phosphate ABC transporter ATP-binding protein PstB [Ktedonobacterales bacterium]|jgi:phosphate transport system ATP-binding protein|nr:phosphate ABC transporter ATP-binding protein PstB [Ktedonobacterales bacterium]